MSLDVDRQHSLLQILGLRCTSAYFRELTLVTGAQVPAQRLNRCSNTRCAAASPSWLASINVLSSVSAFTTDVPPILAMARLRTGGAIAPIEIYRALFYRKHKTQERPPVAGTSAGIV